MKKSGVSKARRYAGTGGAIGLARVVAQAAQFIGFVFAARYLGVEDFGTYALAMVATLFLLLFAGFGWPQLAATKDAERPEALRLATMAGWTLSGLALCLVTGLWAAGFLSDALAGLGLCLVPLFLLRARTNVWGACLIVDGRAGRVARAEAASELAALVTVIAALLAGAGLIALGLAKLAQEIVAYLLVRRETDFAHAAPLRPGAVREQVRFALHTIAGRTVSFVNENLSTVLIGGFLGAANTGLYRAAARFASSGREVVFEALRSTSWVLLKDEGQGALKDRVRSLLYWSLLAGCLCLAGLASVADLVVGLLLGPEWSAAAPIAAVLAIRSILLLPASALEPVLSLTGLVHLAPRLALVNAVVSALLLLLMAPGGIYWAAVSQVLAGVVTLGTTIWALSRATGLTATDFAKLCVLPIICTLSMLLVVLGFRALHADPTVFSQAVELVGAIGLGVAGFAIALVGLDRNVARKLRRFRKAQD